MTNSKHTPTPYSVESDGQDVWIGAGKKKIDVLSDYNGTEEAKANAKLIVRAVNSHEALVEALKEALEFVKSECDEHEVDSRRGDFSLLEVIEKAIEKAERR